MRFRASATTGYITISASSRAPCMVGRGGSKNRLGGSAVRPSPSPERPAMRFWNSRLSLLKYCAQQHRAHQLSIPFLNCDLLKSGVETYFVMLSRKASILRARMRLCSHTHIWLEIVLRTGAFRQPSEGYIYSSISKESFKKKICMPGRFEEVKVSGQCFNTLSLHTCKHRAAASIGGST